MSKSNVNPNHYKVAGRSRQGEDIPQARNRQKHAESLVRRRAEPSAAPQHAAVARGAASTRAARLDTPDDRDDTTITRKTRAMPLHTPPGRKRGQNLVPGSSAPHVRFAKAAPPGALPPTGAIPALITTHATKKASVNLQAGDKRGTRSTAQKRAASRHAFGAMPATGAVAGAFGKEPSPRRSPIRRG